MLSGKERDRLKVLHEVQGGHLTQGEAAGQLEISDREVRRLLARIAAEGDRGVVHRLRGRASNRRLAESLRSRALKLVKAKYRDFGPTLACEYLAQDDALEVSKETLRGWMMAAGLRRGKRRRVEEVHVWRRRRSCRGAKWRSALARPGMCNLPSIRACWRSSMSMPTSGTWFRENTSSPLARRRET